MKQHITKEQFEVILKNTTIQEWMKIEKKLSLKKVNSTNFEEIQRLLAEQLTIGKMIEILGEDFCSIERTADDTFCINVFTLTEDSPKYFEDESICDALWEAVKYVLEQEDKQ